MGRQERHRQNRGGRYLRGASRYNQPRPDYKDQFKIRSLEIIFYEVNFMKLRRMFYVLFIPMFLQSAAFASTPDAGLPGAYLNYIGGTRANAMGRAYVGIAEGADAPAWNPAGLGFLRPNTFSLSHARTVEQASLDNIMYAQPFFKW